MSKMNMFSRMLGKASAAIAAYQQNNSSTNSSGTIQPAETMQDSFSQPSTISTGSQSGGTSGLGQHLATAYAKQGQPQGSVLDTQIAQPYASDYDSQSSAQSMNVNPMLNNSIGSLGQNNTGGIGLSSGLGNMFTTQKSNGLGNIGYNPQGNNYNIIGGAELV